MLNTTENINKFQLIDPNNKIFIDSHQSGINITENKINLKQPGLNDFRELIDKNDKKTRKGSADYRINIKLKLESTTEITEEKEKKLGPEKESTSKDQIENNTSNISGTDNYSNKKYNNQTLSLSELSEKNKSHSLSYSQIEGLSSLGIEVPKENKKEFPEYKLKIIKSNLNLEELEEMDGKAYEDYCRKILKIMFLITIKKEIFFENPQKISFSNIINFYSKNAFRYKLKINGPIKNILNDNIQEGNELDIVYSLKYKELINISEKFQKYFLLNKLDINNNKSNNNILDIEEPEITIIGEIAKNIIKQGKEKLSQIIGYMKVISIMNILKDSDLAKNDEYLKICEEYKCTPKSEKILLIITDGNYSKLKEMIQFFEKEIFDQNISQVDIRLKISTFVEKDIFSDEANKESLQDNIYYNYLLFENLKKNHIKHALIYIGDITNINYEEVYNKLLNIDEKKIFNKKTF
jgi:hypothetical protein